MWWCNIVDKWDKVGNTKNVNWRIQAYNRR